LDVVVEAGDFGGVLVEYAAGVVQTEILLVESVINLHLGYGIAYEVDVGLGVVLPSSGDERIHELVVLLTSDTLLLEAEI
jgi:hypothetical protein